MCDTGRQLEEAHSMSFDLVTWSGQVADETGGFTAGRPRTIGGSQATPGGWGRHERVA